MKKLLIIIALFTSGFAKAQKLPGDGFDKIRITEPDKTIQADLKQVSSDPEMQTDRFYYWYSGNAVHTTQGGFSGRLLNGDYKEYYLNKNLKELGQFRKGLKNGVWRGWNENGLLLEMYTWKDGVKQGTFSLYDNNGKIKQSGTYQHDLLNGNIKNYNDAGSAPTVIVYQDGHAVNKKPSSFWSRLNFFKKKKGDGPKPVPSKK